jgi:hypothetical protein
VNVAGGCNAHLLFRCVVSVVLTASRGSSLSHDAVGTLPMLRRDQTSGAHASGGQIFLTLSTQIRRGSSWRRARLAVQHFERSTAVEFRGEVDRTVDRTLGVPVSFMAG